MEESIKIFTEEIKRPDARATFDDHVKYMIECRRWQERYVIARINETSESPIEKIVALYLWQWQLDDPDIRIFPQKNVGKYRVDFCIECKNKKIIIECDGHDFHEKTKEQAARDKKRDRYLVSEGYTVMRYTGSEIVHNPNQIIRDLEPLVYPEIAELCRND